MALYSYYSPYDRAFLKTVIYYNKQNLVYIIIIYGLQSLTNLLKISLFCF